MKNSPVMATVRQKLWPLKVLLDDVNRIGLPKQAEAMAYTTLFSLVPSLAVVFTLISLFLPFLGEQGALMSKAHEFILQNLAAGSGEQAVEYLSSFIANLDIKKIGISSFAFLIATLVLLLRQIEMALNKIWNIRKMRNLFVRFIYFWTFLTLGVFALAIVVGVVSSAHMGTILSALGLRESVVATGSVFGDVMRSTATWAGIFSFFFLLFKIVPNTQVSVREAAIGALVASIMFHQGGRIYGIYISGFSKYASVYGALAAVPVFLMWLYLSWVIVLFGALVSWRVQQGFPKMESEEGFTVAVTGVERLRNSHVQGILPLIILIAVYQRFREGSGKGVTKLELVKKMKLPASWLDDALEVLNERNLIVLSASSDSDKASSKGYYPTFPAQKITLDKAIGDILQGAQDWLSSWDQEFPMDIKAKLIEIAKFANFDSKKMQTTTISDLL